MPQSTIRHPAMSAATLAWLILGGIAAFLLILGGFLIWLPFEQEQRCLRWVEVEQGSSAVEPNRPAWLPKFVRDWGLFDRVTAINLYGDRITDADISKLLALKKLTSLELFSTPHVGDQGLQTISEISGLTSLNLLETNITDAGLIHLTRMSKLETLFLQTDHGKRFSDAGLIHLKAIPRLKSLILTRTQISNAGLLELVQSLPNLKCLSLTGHEVNDELLEAIQRMPVLEDLEISETLFGNEQLSRLSELTRLKRLSLCRTQVDDAGLVFLKKLTNLEQLNLSQLKITHEGLGQLRGFTKLQHLTLDRNDFDRRAFLESMKKP